MRLLPLLVLALALCLASCSGDEKLKARTEKLPAFAISLPDGWQTNIPDGMECTVGRCIAGFTKTTSGHREALTVSVVPSLGKSLQEIADETTAGLKAKDAVMDVVRQDDRCIEYRGLIKDNQARLLATIDSDRQEVGILLLVGEGGGLDEVAATVQMANPKLDFGLGAGAR
ncbi:MAG: hypothetical protein J5863_09910 [Desulfovibrio sp.]|nr:hypothetical protein [Desulfovibrio sp.]